jgi:capsular polysaccharide biosynthesis protein
MSRQESERTSVSLREIVRWWPLVVVVTLIAVGGAIWSATRQVPSYTATATAVLVPLSQYDETFFGTDLLRETSDPSRTTATAAVVLNSARAATVAADYLGNGWSPDSIASSVSASPLEGANVIEVTAQQREPDQAAKLAEGYVKATLADRWRTISAQLDTRIAAVSSSIAATPGDPNLGDLYARLQSFKSVRAGSSDPTMKFDSTSAPVRVAQLSMATTVTGALLGGLCVGLFAAVFAAMLRSRISRQAEPIAAHPPTEANAASQGL